MAEIIDGKKLAEEVLAKVKSKTAQLKQQRGLQPGLAVIIAGDDAASAVYVASKGRKAEECGFHAATIRLPADIAQAELPEHIAKLNADPAIHGILVQLPLPAQLDAQAVLQAIAPEKDVDGLTYGNIGRLAANGGQSAAQDTDLAGFTPCTPAGIALIVRRIHGADLSGLDAVIVGRSNIVGKPAAALLLAANATVTVTHSRTRDLPEVIRSADILVAAAGQPEMVKGGWIKPGATVIDVGINRLKPRRAAKGGGGKESGKPRLVGDVEFDTASIIAGHITPVPGGVGPLTIAMLMANTLRAACREAGESMPDFSAE